MTGDQTRKDCIKFLEGLSYTIEEKDDYLFAKKRLHNRFDNILVRFLYDTPDNSIPRPKWEQLCKDFDKAGSRLGKYLIVRDGVAITTRHETEARQHRFVPLHFRGFLTRFAKLDDLRAEVKKRLFEEHSDRQKIEDAFVDPKITIGPDGQPHAATPYLTQYWLGENSHGLLVLLAPPGHGKSTLTVRISSRLLDTSSIPILIPFAAYRRLVTFESLIYEFFVKHRHETLSPDALSVILKYNLATIILDGFDELCETAGIGTARENLNAVYKGIATGGKVLLTARTAFFRSVIPSSPNGDIRWDEAHLEPFSEEQRVDFIRRRANLSEPNRNKLLDLLKIVPTADELASSPLVLTELCDMADDLGGPDSFDYGIAQIYEWLLERHCVREQERQGYEFGPEIQRAILGEIAEWCLLELSEDQSSHKAKAEYVEQIIESHLKSRRVHDRDAIRLAIPKLFGHALFTITKTNNPAERYLRFLHHTWHDFLIAKRISEYVKSGDSSKVAETLSYYRVLPEYVAKFLADMLNEADAKLLFSFPELRSREKFSLLLRIAQEYARRRFRPFSGDATQERNYFLGLIGIRSFEGRDIWQAQFVYLSLGTISFKDSLFADTAFRKCDLRGADFSNSTLQRVAFDNCDLDKAIFNNISGLSIQDKERLIQAGAIVDAVDHGEKHRTQLIRELVRKVLAKFKTHSTHQREPTWMRIPVKPRAVSV